MEIKLELSERIDDLMKKNKISGKELSTLTRISTTTISEILNGKRKNPTSDVIIKLAKALNASTDYLLGMSILESPLEDNKTVNKIIGLDDEAINALTRIKNYGYNNSVNSFLSSHFFYNIVRQLGNIDNMQAAFSDEIKKKPYDEIAIQDIHKEMLISKYEAGNWLNRYIENKSSIDEAIMRSISNIAEIKKTKKALRRKEVHNETT
jgi:transcriptional regulator with XRE-family HTH domain